MRNTAENVRTPRGNGRTGPGKTAGNRRLAAPLRDILAAPAILAAAALAAAAAAAVVLALVLAEPALAHSDNCPTGQVATIHQNTCVAETAIGFADWCEGKGGEYRHASPNAQCYAPQSVNTVSSSRAWCEPFVYFRRTASSPRRAVCQQGGGSANAATEYSDGSCLLPATDPNSYNAAVHGCAVPGGCTKTVQDAAEEGDLAQIRCHINNGETDLNAGVGHNSRTPLHWAVIGNRPEIVRDLLTVAALAPNRQDAVHGSSPLIEAAFLGRTEIAGILANHPLVSLNLPNNYGGTAMHNAAARGHLAVVNTLIAAGAMVNPPPDDNSRTPLGAARNANHQDIVRRLIAAGANYGQTCTLPERVNPAAETPPCLDYVTISLSSSENGAVSAGWAGDANLQNGGTVPRNAAVTFTATPAANFYVSGWTGDCQGVGTRGNFNAPGAPQPCEISPAADVVVGAVFTRGLTCAAGLIVQDGQCVADPAALYEHYFPAADRLSKCQGLDGNQGAVGVIDPDAADPAAIVAYVCHTQGSGDVCYQRKDGEAGISGFKTSNLAHTFDDDYDNENPRCFDHAPPCYGSAGLDAAKNPFTENCSGEPACPVGKIQDSADRCVDPCPDGNAPGKYNDCNTPRYTDTTACTTVDPEVNPVGGSVLGSGVNASCARWPQAHFFVETHALNLLCKFNPLTTIEYCPNVWAQMRANDCLTRGLVFKDGDIHSRDLTCVCPATGEPGACIVQATVFITDSPNGTISVSWAGDDDVQNEETVPSETVQTEIVSAGRPGISDQQLRSHYSTAGGDGCGNRSGVFPEFGMQRNGVGVGYFCYRSLPSDIDCVVFNPGVTPDAPYQFRDGGGNLHPSASTSYAAGTHMICNEKFAPCVTGNSLDSRNPFTANCNRADYDAVKTAVAAVTRTRRVATAVTFTARPDDDFYVSGWSGDCESAGDAGEFAAPGAPQTCVRTAAMNVTVGAVFTQGLVCEGGLVIRDGECVVDSAGLYEHYFPVADRVSRCQGLAGTQRAVGVVAPGTTSQGAPVVAYVCHTEGGGDVCYQREDGEAGLAEFKTSNLAHTFNAAYDENTPRCADHAPPCYDEDDDLDHFQNPFTANCAGPPGSGPRATVFISTSANGTVSAESSGGSEVQNEGTVPVGTTVTFTAEPESGYGFSAWTGDCQGEANPCALEVTTAVTVGADFVYTGEYTGACALSAFSEGNRAKVSLQIDNCNAKGWGVVEQLHLLCHCDIKIGDNIGCLPATASSRIGGNFQTGGSVGNIYAAFYFGDSLQHLPQKTEANQDACFVAHCPAGQAPSGFNMNGETECVGLPVTVFISDSVNGTVSAGRAGDSEVLDEEEVPFGALVTFTATPDLGYGFSSWTGACLGEANPCAVDATADVTVGADFACAKSLLLAAGGDLSQVQCNLDAGADVNATGGNNNRSPLHWAVIGQQVEIIRLLLAAAGIDPNVRDGTYGSNPLIEAAFHGRTEIVGILANHPLVDLNIASNSGNRALHEAAGRGHLAVVNTLLAAGAAVNPVNDASRTPLGEAQNGGHSAIAARLIAVGGHYGAACHLLGGTVNPSASSPPCLGLPPLNLSAGALYEHYFPESGRGAKCEGYSATAVGSALFANSSGTGAGAGYACRDGGADLCYLSHNNTPPNSLWRTGGHALDSAAPECPAFRPPCLGANGQPDNARNPFAEICLGAVLPPLVSVVLTESPNGMVSAKWQHDPDLRSGEELPLGTTVTFTAEPDADFYVSGWSGGCDGVGEAGEEASPGASQPCVLQVTVNATVGAVFDPGALAGFVRYSKLPGGREGNGGAVTVAGREPDAPFEVAGGATVTFTATPNSGWTVTWNDEAGCDDNDPACEIAVSGDVNVTAIFDAGNDARLEEYFPAAAPNRHCQALGGRADAVTQPGGGGVGRMCIRISAAPFHPLCLQLGASFDPALRLSDDDGVDVRDYNSAAHGHDGFPPICSAAYPDCGGGQVKQGGNPFAACVDPPRATVFISESPGGTVSAEWSGDADLQNEDTVPHGTTVTFTAAPGGGRYVSGWTGGCAGEATAQCVLEVAANVTVGAVFTETALDRAMFEAMSYRAYEGNLAGRNRTAADTIAGLLQQGANPNATNSSVDPWLIQTSALGAAAYLQNGDALYNLLVAGADPYSPGRRASPAVAMLAYQYDGRASVWPQVLPALRRFLEGLQAAGVEDYDWNDGRPMNQLGESGGGAAAGNPDRLEIAALMFERGGRCSGAAATDAEAHCGIPSVTIRSALPFSQVGDVLTLTARDFAGATFKMPPPDAGKIAELEGDNWRLRAENPADGPARLVLSRAMSTADAAAIFTVTMRTADSSADDVRLIHAEARLETPPPVSVFISDSANGTVSAEWSGDADLQDEDTVPFGTTVTFTASPDPDYQFSGWTDACAGEANPCVLRATANATVGAEFVSAAARVVNYSKLPGGRAGNGGTLTEADGRAGGFQVAAGATVTFTAAPAGGGWTVTWNDESGCDDNQLVCEVAVSDHLNLTAIFDAGDDARLEEYFPAATPNQRCQTIGGRADPVRQGGVPVGRACVRISAAPHHAICLQLGASFNPALALFDDNGADVRIYDSADPDHGHDGFPPLCSATHPPCDGGQVKRDGNPFAECADPPLVVSYSKRPGGNENNGGTLAEAEGRASGFEVARGATVTFTAAPNPGWTLAWNPESGCDDNDPTCEIVAAENVNLTATFGTGDDALLEKYFPAANRDQLCESSSAHPTNSAFGIFEDVPPFTKRVGHSCFEQGVGWLCIQFGENYNPALNVYDDDSGNTVLDFPPLCSQAFPDCVGDQAKLGGDLFAPCVAPSTIFITPSPGGIVSARWGGNPDLQNEETVPFGTQVTFAAEPDPGHAFAAWTGDCQGRPNPCVREATADLTVGATFPLLVTISRDRPDNAELSAVLPPDADPLPTLLVTFADLPVRFTADPAPGHFIAEWQGVPPGQSCPPPGDVGQAQTCEITPAANLHIAVVARLARRLFYSHSPGGTVRAEDSQGRTVPDRGEIRDRFRLVATPDPGFFIALWRADGADGAETCPAGIAADSAQTCPLQAQGRNAHAYVKFQPARRVSVAAAENGTVAARDHPDPAQARDLSAGGLIPDGATLHLTATPDDGHFIFEWLGAPEDNACPKGQAVTVATECAFPVRRDLEAGAVFAALPESVMRIEISEAYLRENCKTENIKGPGATNPLALALDLKNSANETIGAICHSIPDSLAAAPKADRCYALSPGSIGTPPSEFASGSAGPDSEFLSCGEELLCASRGIAPLDGNHFNEFPENCPTVAHRVTVVQTDGGNTKLYRSDRQTEIGDESSGYGGEFESGTEVAFGSTPFSGNYISKWHGLDGCLEGFSARPFEVFCPHRVSGPLEVSVSFARTPAAVSVLYSHSSGGTLRASVSAGSLSSGETVGLLATVDFSAVADSGFYVSGWVGAEVSHCASGVGATLVLCRAEAVRHPLEVRADFAAEAVFHRVDFSASSGGTLRVLDLRARRVVSGSQPGVLSGSLLRLDADADSGFHLFGWGGWSGASSCGRGVFTVSEVCEVRAESPLAVRAEFRRFHRADFSAGGVGGTGGTVSAVDFRGESVSPGGRVSGGTTVTFTAVPAADFYVSGWVGGCDGAGEVGGPAGAVRACVLPVSGDVSAEAVFVRAARVLIAASAGGVVSAEVSGGAAVGDGGTIPRGSEVVFTAEPDAGFYVLGWSGDCEGAGEAGGPAGAVRTCVLTAGREVSAGAIFVRAAAVFITVGANGTVSAEWSGDAEVRDGEAVPAGTTVTFTAEPDADFYVSGWVGGCAGVGGRGDFGAPGAMEFCELEVGADVTVGAVFAPGLVCDSGLVIENGECVFAPAALYEHYFPVADRAAKCAVAAADTGTTPLYDGTDPAVRSEVGHACFDKVAGADICFQAADGRPGSSLHTAVLNPATPGLPYPLNANAEKCSEVRPPCLDASGALDDGQNPFTDFCTGLPAVPVSVFISPSANGAVSAEWSGDPEVQDGETVPHRTEVTFTARPDADFYVSGWSGDCEGAGDSGGPPGAPRTCGLTARKNVTVGAVFVRAGQIFITDSPNGTVSAEWAGDANLQSEGTVPLGTAVTFTASPDAGFYVSGWSGGCDGAGATGEFASPGTPRPCELEVGRRATVGAVFTRGLACNAGFKIDNGACVADPAALYEHYFPAADRLSKCDAVSSAIDRAVEVRDAGQEVARICRDQDAGMDLCYLKIDGGSGIANLATHPGGYTFTAADSDNASLCTDTHPPCYDSSGALDDGQNPFADNCAGLPSLATVFISPSANGAVSAEWSGDANLQNGETVLLGATVTFTATPADGRKLTLWTGACAGDSVEDAKCVLAGVAMDVTVGAEFGCLDFHESAAAGNLAGLKCGAAAGADVNAPDAQGRTPLHLAAGGGRLEAARELLTLGATLNALDDDDETPLTKALAGNHMAVFALLVAAGGRHAGAECGPAEVPNSNGASPPCEPCGTNQIASGGVCESCGTGEVESGGACECASDHAPINGLCVHKTNALPETERTCAEVFSGDWVDLSAEHGPGKGVCSGVDINDTFCLMGAGSALPCLGLFNHVRSCNLLSRPALDPWHCGKACPNGASGARCLE